MKPTLGLVTRGLLVSGGLAFSAHSASAASETWNRTTTGGLWSTLSNWASGTGYADGIGSIATLNTSTGQPFDMTLDVDVTLGGITFNSGGQSDAFGWRIGSSNGHTLNLASGTANAPVFDVRGTSIITAQISGAQGFTKTNAGKLTVSGSNNYTGVTTVTGGNLTVSSGSGLGATGAGNGTVVSRSNNNQFPQLHLLNIATAENFTLRQSYSDATAGNTIGGILLYNDSGVTNLSGSLTLERGSVGVNNVAEIGIQSGGQLTIEGAVTGSLTGTQASGNYADATRLTLRSATAASSTINVTGAISDGNLGTGGLSVYTTTNSLGIIRLSGNNTYTGSTVHQAGSLLINNSAGSSGTGTGSVIVKSGATLGGVGFIAPAGANSITFESGSTVSPGNLTDANVAIANGEVLTFNLAGTTGSATFAAGSIIALNLNANLNLYESLAFTGLSSDLTSRVHFNNNTVNFSITGTSLAPGLYTIATFDGLYDGTWSIGTGLSAYNASLVYNANNIQLLVSAIPEPSTAAILVGLAALGYVAVGKRRRV